MDSDRLIGAGIVIGCIIAAILYFGFMFMGYGTQVVMTVVSIAFVIVLGIGGWIGYTMASTPAPEPVEDLDEMEEEELGESETPEQTENQ
ncbi:hypothetical protein AKJ51_00615 [candidate division MSBL1 archaeon SCGC-AAA382A20]|uniref:Transcriptional regulator n=1 Tax=candidate division MSBL1 archaeon SCGC-AAA382A20 TaxID=1698280 RepID=A0A133VMP4_9EURY|nr:hypothetical protein AKJ51_00615 [candidate division MSBL1 archaeon SCGC-AAA382A20]